MSQKLIGLKDVIIMTLVANLGIRWLAIAAGMGPISLMFWVLGAVLFLIPISLIVAEFSSKYQDEGGVYAWVRHQLGDGPAFVVSWFYWVNNLFFYPAILTFFVTSLTYVLNKPALASNETFVTLAVIITFWIATLLTIGGIRLSKGVSEFGGVFGSLLIITILIVLSLVYYFKFHVSATTFDLAAFKFSSGMMSNLSSLSVLMFAMAGIEIIPTLANIVKNPTKTLPRGLIIAAFLMLIFYLLGTLAMNIMATPGQIANTTGLMSTFGIISIKLHLPWLNQLMALLLVFAEIGALTVWIFVPVIMFFKATERGILPQWLYRQNSKQMPVAALLFQAVLVTLIISLSALMPSVNLMYQVMVLMTTTTYFIPYFFLIAAFLCFKLKHKSHGLYKVPGGSVGAIILSGCVLFSLVLAILVSFVPTANLTTHHEILIYELELVGGPVLLFLIALGLYWRAKHRF